MGEREAVCVCLSGCGGVCAGEYECNWLRVCALSHRLGDDGTCGAQGTLHAWVLIPILPLSHQLVLGRSLRGLKSVFPVMKCDEWGLLGFWSWV